MRHSSPRATRSKTIDPHSGDRQGAASFPTRRTVLAGGLGMAVLTLSPLSVQSASATSGVIVSEVLRAKVLDATLTSAVTLDFPVGVRITGASRVTLHITIAYDARVFSIYGVSLARRGADVHQLDASHVSHGGRGETSFEIPADASGEAELRIGVARLDRYPEEGVAEPAPTRLAVNSLVDRTLHASAPVPVTAWGLEVYPMWEDIILARSNGAIYRYPVGARILGVGPSASPEGVGLDLVFDHRVISKIGMVSSSSNSSGIPATHLGAANGLLAIALPPVIPGEALDLRFAAERVEDPGPLSTVRRSSVEVVLPADDPTTLVRSTGRYSVVDTTPSGNALVEDVLEGRI